MLRKLSFQQNIVGDNLNSDIEELEKDLAKIEGIIAKNENASAESKAVFDMLKNSIDEMKRGNYETLRKLHQENKMLANLAFATKVNGAEYNELITVIQKMNQTIDENTRPYINAFKGVGNFGIEKSINLLQSSFQSMFAEMPPIVKSLFDGGKDAFSRFKQYRENRAAQKQELDANFKEYLKNYGKSPEEQIVAEISHAMQEGMNEELVAQLQGTDNLPQMVEFLKNSTVFNKRLADEMKKLAESPEKQQELVIQIKKALENNPDEGKENFLDKERQETYQRDSVEATRTVADKLDLLIEATEKNTKASENQNNSLLSGLTKFLPAGLRDAIAGVVQAPLNVIAKGKDVVKAGASAAAKTVAKGGEVVAKGGKVALEGTKKVAQKGAEKLGSTAAGQAVKKGAQVLGKNLLKAVPVVGTAVMAYEAVSLVQDIVKNDPMFSDIEKLEENISKATEPQERTDGLDLTSGLDDESMENVEMWRESTEQRANEKGKNESVIAFEKNLEFLKQMHKEGTTTSWNPLGGHFGESRDDIIAEMAENWEGMDNVTKDKYRTLGLDPTTLYGTTANGNFTFKETEGGSLAALYGNDAVGVGAEHDALQAKIREGADKYQDFRMEKLLDKADEHARLSDVNFRMGSQEGYRYHEAMIDKTTDATLSVATGQQQAHDIMRQEAVLKKYALENSASGQQASGNVTNITNNNVVNNTSSKGGSGGFLSNPSADAARGSSPVETRW